MLIELPSHGFRSIPQATPFRPLAPPCNHIINRWRDSQVCFCPLVWYQLAELTCISQLSSHLWVVPLFPLVLSTKWLLQRELNLSNAHQLVQAFKVQLHSRFQVFPVAHVGDLDVNVSKNN
jgi:hypothetical protein